VAEADETDEGRDRSQRAHHGGRSEDHRAIAPADPPPPEAEKEPDA
jgi:hypothetical protein